MIPKSKATKQITTMSNTCRLVLLLSLFVGCCHSVINPPRFHTTIKQFNNDNYNSNKLAKNGTEIKSVASYAGVEHEDSHSAKYTLTISEGQTIETQVNSRAVITICLNRNVAEEVSINVTVLARPDLIHFTQQPNGTTSFIVIYAPNEFGERAIEFATKDIAGHAEVVCKVVKQPADGTIIDDTKAFSSIDIAKSWGVTLLTTIVGWIYFFAWSVSFYAQVKLNHDRKSVIGLNFDFLSLNLLGFTAYTIYNAALLFSKEAQDDYYARNSYHRIPVEYNDLFFAVHALAITIVTIIQCFIYERGVQSVSLFTRVFVTLSAMVSLALYISHFFTSLTILDVVLFISYVKLAVTLIKYLPQAYMNYSNKSTEGWSIVNIILDFTGGLFSLFQMFLIAYNYDDWLSIFGNFTKFGLGLFSICFDILFFIQHYVLYRGNLNRLGGGGNTGDSSRQLSTESRTDQSTFSDQVSNLSANSDDEEAERQRKILVSSGAIKSNQVNKDTNGQSDIGAYINDNLIA